MSGALQAVFQNQRSFGAPPATNPPFQYVTMLLHGDGTNGAQNNTFLDSSSSARAVTRNGNTTQGSFSPYGSNWSNYSTGDAGSGSGTYLTTPSVSLSGDFTVEMWVFFDSASEYNRPFGLGNGSASDGGYIFNGGYLNAKMGSVSYSGGSGVVGWNHIAFSRASGALKIFLNGTQIASGSDSTTIAGAVSIGSYVATGTRYFGTSQYISNLRIVNGTALYTTTFTPPTASLTAVSGTLLLTCQSNRFVDNSASPLTITVNGTPSVQRFSPFAPASAYSTATIGGSGYFDGTGDNLSVAANSSNLGTGNFNITFWVYFTSDSGASVPATNAYNGGSFTDGWYFYGSSGTSIFFGIGDPTTASSVSGALSGINSWHYVEATRSGSTLSIYVDGVLAESKTNTNSGTSSGNVTRIGARLDGTALYFPGYITDFKVVIGTAGNTSNYTPPTAPASATGSTFTLSMQNAGIFDNAMMNDLETVGNAQISTSVVKYGTGSLSFDGTGDWLRSPDNLGIAFGSGNFTVEGWINLNNIIATKGILFGIGNNSFGLRVGQGYLGDVNGLNITRSGVADLEYCAFTFFVNTWYHIAVVRSGTTIYFFVNGTQQTTQGSGGSSYNFATPTSGFIIGANNDTNEPFNGYMDDLRITKGVAVYTSNFTPPTAAFPNT